MSQNKKPVVFVAIALGALIILPLVILMISRVGGNSQVSSSGETPVSTGRGDAEIADFDLRKLADRVHGLLDNEMAAALRKGDISLDLMADLSRDAEKGRSAMASGKLERAKKYYHEALVVAEAQLEALGLADKARRLNDSTYAELKRLEYLESAFQNTYREAVETYNSALRSLNAGDFQASVNDYEMTGAILGDLEARSMQQVASLIESANAALEAYNLDAAKSGYEEVLRIDSANTAATDGVAMVQALEGIADEVKAIKALEDAGEFEAALKQLDQLAADQPNNPFLRNQRKAIEAKILERDYQALLIEVSAAEAAEDYPRAIMALEKAIALKSTPKQVQRLAELEAKYKAIRLEELLSAGYSALKAGSNGSAREIYKEALAIDPNSKEARNGLEKASSLYLAGIRYTQHITNTKKYMKEGRYPLASKFFNDAMASRPSNVSSAEQEEEAELRAKLEAQSKEVRVTIESDKRTYVSLIGVLPPDKFKDKDLKLYPDVYTVKGTRSGYESVEITLKVDATKPNPTITVECTDKL
ncbi:MAG: hypothetical protein ACSHX8_02875 [Opitutaceae bacterium]